MNILILINFNNIITENHDNINYIVNIDIMDSIFNILK
jgi:hypothetical protein